MGPMRVFIVIVQAGVRLKDDIDLDELRDGKGVEFTIDEDSLQKAEAYIPGRLIVPQYTTSLWEGNVC